MEKKLNYLHLFESDKIKVKNAVGTTENGVNQLEKYFKEKYNIDIPTNWECSLCEKNIVRKLSGNHPFFSKNDIMVGGHLKDVNTGILYLAPICKECNDKKENLPEFTVEANKLLLL